MIYDIIEYIGKYDDGVMVLLSINHNDVYYDATFFYKLDLVVLTVDEKLENILGYEIEKWEGYNNIILDIMKKVIPYNDVINTLDEI